MPGACINKKSRLWRVKGGNDDGWGPYPELWSFTIVTSTSVGDDHTPAPSGFRLRQNTPNPFNPSTRIGFSLPENSDVCIEFYNVLGQKIDSIDLKFMHSGEHTTVWDGSRFPSGVYFYKLTAGESFEIKKMTLLK